MSPPRAALSVDVEFFSHTPAYRSAAGTTSESAVGHDGVRFLLDAFADADARGTFFAVSEIAETHPDLVRAIAVRHELASHTHSHRHLSELSTADRRAELADSKERLEAVAGTDVTGFRAPSFDFGPDHFDLLAETGYSYDSSVAPCRSIPGWYGGEYDTVRPVPASLLRDGAPATVAEVPIAVMPGLGLPLTGTWIRFFGVRYTLLGMRLLARRGITPVLYVHPWELVDLPDVDGVPNRVYYRSGEYMRHAVERILAANFEFVPVADVAATAHAAEQTQAATAGHGPDDGTGGAATDE